MGDWQDVKSSNVEAVKHDPVTNVLSVRFIGGNVYNYADVPADKHVALLGAESIGKHLRDHIQGKHDYKKAG